MNKLERLKVYSLAILLVVLIVFSVRHTHTYNGLNAGIVLDVPYTSYGVGMETRGSVGLFVVEQGE